MTYNQTITDQTRQALDTFDFNEAFTHFQGRSRHYSRSRFETANMDKKEAYHMKVSVL